MSNALAIAAVTIALRHLLQQRFDAESSGGITVTTRPLDKVGDNIDIERLILEGVAISPRQGRLLQAVVEAELARLLSAEGLPDNWQAGGIVPHVPSGAIQ
ncbi:MAG: hypothetical protein V7K30_33435 [Nostoc sp.]